MRPKVKNQTRLSSKHQLHIYYMRVHIFLRKTEVSAELYKDNEKCKLSFADFHNKVDVKIIFHPLSSMAIF